YPGHAVLLAPRRERPDPHRLHRDGPRGDPRPPHHARSGGPRLDRRRPVLSAMKRVARGVRTAMPFLILPLLLDAIFIWEIVGSTGGTLCPTLDDAFIHFEYARSLVEGRPLSYNPGDPATTG